MASNKEVVDKRIPPYQKRGKFLAELRNEKGLTQEELGKKLHYTHTAVSKWERGLSFPMDPDVISKMAEIFDVSMEELLYGERKNNKNSKDIRDNIVKEYTNNYQKYKKRILIMMFTLLVSIIAFLIATYFIFIRNSISVYSIYVDSDNIKIENSSLIVSNKLGMLNFNKIIPSSDKEITRVKLYYLTDDNVERLVISGPNEDYYLEELNGYDEYNLYNLPNVRFYVEVRYEDGEKENYQIELEKTFTNDNIFPKRVDSISDDSTRRTVNINEEDAIKKLKDEGFKYNPGVFYKDFENATFMIFDSTYSFEIWSGTSFIRSELDSSEISYDYHDENDKFQSVTIETTEEIDCNKRKCKSVDDYVGYINRIKRILK